MSSDEMIVVAKEELERLRKLEADLPALLVKAKAEEAKDALTRLHQRDKENPEKHRERSKKAYERNKEKILSKRHEAYRLKKEAKAAEERFALAEKSPDSI